MSYWQNKRLADLALLLKWLLGQGASKGVSVTREDMANGTGFPVSRVDALVRWLREHPELGWTISMQHGTPWVVVSTPKQVISGQAIFSERVIQENNRMDLYWMLTRQMCIEFVHFNNISVNAKGSPEAKVATTAKRKHMKELVLIQGAMDRKIQTEDALWLYIDDVLNV
jgi:hypothetical protein